MPRVLLVFALLALTTTTLLATTHLVDQTGAGDFTTIGAAVTAASTGDTILIAAGTYQGPDNTNIDVGGKNLVIRSVSGPENTIIDCERLGPSTGAFYLHTGEDTTCVIEGLTILRGYSPNGSGIWCDGASPKIVSCRFDSCGLAYGGGIRLDNSNARIVGCAFSHGSVFVSGGAIFIRNSSPVIRSTTIDSCSAGFIGGGILHYEGGSSTLTDVTIRGCTSGGDGAGFYCEDAPPTLVRVDFVENVADTASGGGLYINCDGSLTDCTFTGNYAGQDGGGIYSWGSFLDIDDCTFTANDAAAGGGIYGEDALLDVTGGAFVDNVAGMGAGVMVTGGVPTLTDITFDGNSAAIYGGGIASSDALAEITGCTFTDNYAYSGAAISCDGLSAPTIERCTLSGNTAEAGGNCALLAEDCDPTITNTIIAFTVDGAGVGCVGTAAPSISHSCSYGNADGDSLCGNHHDNLFTDPLFCDGPVADVSLHDDSPCLPAGNPWGEQIGSKGAGGCGPTSGVPEPPEPLVLFRPRPNPAPGSATVEWSAPGAAGAARVAIYDPSGRLVRTARVTAARDGRGRFVWDGRDESGNEVSSGLYLVRVSVSGREARGTLVLVR